MTKISWIVIANEVKQSHEIAASPRNGVTPRNDKLLCLNF